jgi:Fe-S oxidoreductase
MIFQKLIDKIVPGNTLFYSGCITKYAAPELEDNYKKLLAKLKIECISIPEFYCCGSPVLNAGYTKDFDDLKQKNLELFKKYGIKRIITNCPGCYHIFKDYYGFNAVHFTQILQKNLSKLNLQKQSGQITFHDPCHLGRCGKIYDEPRDILKGIGYEVVEMRDNREKSLCCGAGAGLRNNNPELAKKIAQIRLKQCTSDSIVTPCTMCYMHMKENAPQHIKVYEFSEVLKC